MTGGEDHDAEGVFGSPNMRAGGMWLGIASVVTPNVSARILSREGCGRN